MKLPSLSHSRNQVVLSTPLKNICDKLNKNSLTELKLGFEENEFHSKRDVQQLLKVCKNEYLHKISVDRYSPLRTIRVGWRLPSFVLPILLEQILPLLLSTPYVKHLQLCLDTWVPESTLAKIVSCNHLETLDLRAMRIQIRCVSDPRDNRGRLSVPSSSGTDDSILRILPNLSKSITSLGLVDCDLTTPDIPLLAEALRNIGLSHLSLRLNRRLDGEWKHLLNMGLQSLDLSLCDLDFHMGFSLARALEKSFAIGSRLDKFNVAGNYRMAPAVPQLVRVAATQLRHFNCSFCDVQNKLQHEVFDILATAPSCTLRSFHMQATRVVDASSLIKLVQQNRSLQSLVISHPKETFPLSREDLKVLNQTLPLNYHLGHFQFDCERQYWKYRDSLQFWLQLNKCGRRVLLNDSKGLSWSMVLARAAQLPDKQVLQWLVRNGVEHFAR
jgi:hypothetical protein